MPFTFSHPALVLPLKYIPARFVSMTGLIIGSLTPDFEYFLQMKIQSNYSHTFNGVFWFDLPVGILLAFLFHNIIRNNLFANLPAFIRSRFYRLESFNWNAYFCKNWFIIIISILIGTASHIFWDSFTHPDGYFVGTIPALNNNIRISCTEVPILKVLQHGSSILGAVILATAILKLPVQTVTKSEVQLSYWIIFTFLFLAIILVRLLTGLSIRAYGDVIVTAISAGLIALSVTPYFMKIVRDIL